jgi:hypothetical protein
MARWLGKDLAVLIENSGGTEVALGNVTEAVTPDNLNPLVQFEGDDVKSYQAGQSDANGTIECEYDDTASTGNWAVVKAIKADNTAGHMIRIRPHGSTSGYPEFACDSVIDANIVPNRTGKLVVRIAYGQHTEASADAAWGTVTP